MSNEFGGESASHPRETDPVGHSETMTRRRLLQTAGAAGIAGIAGCSDGTAGGAETFKVGLNVPLSGGNSLIGEGMANSAEIAKTKINDDGGLAGREIELIRADNEGDPQTGVERTNQLINEDNVDVIVGPVSSAVRNSMTPICESNQIPLLYPTSYEGPAAPDYCSEYLFKFSWVPTQQVEPVIPWLIEEYGTDFYLLGSDYLWPQEMNAAIRDEVEANGGTILEEQYVQLGTTDFSSVLVGIEEADPDILLSEVVGASPAALQNQLRNRGLRDDFTEIGLGHSEPSMAGLGPDAAEGVINITGHHTSMDNETNQQFMETYHDQYGDDAILGAIGAWTHTTIMMLNEALVDADDASTDTILESLPGTSMESVSGPVTMSHDHQMELACVAAQMNSDVEFETIQEFDAAMPPEQCSEI